MREAEGGQRRAATRSFTSVTAAMHSSVPPGVGCADSWMARDGLGNTVVSSPTHSVSAWPIIHALSLETVPRTSPGSSAPVDSERRVCAACGQNTEKRSVMMDSAAELAVRMMWRSRPLSTEERVKHGCQSGVSSLTNVLHISSAAQQIACSLFSRDSVCLVRLPGGGRPAPGKSAHSWSVTTAKSKRE